MPANSIEALAFSKLVEAIAGAIDSGSREEPFEFMKSLHEAGFMVVAIPPEPGPAYEPTAFIPATDPSFATLPKPQVMEWEPWLAAVTKAYGADPHMPTARVMFDKGMTPAEAVDDLIPF